jgi:hypothetical protein
MLIGLLDAVVGMLERFAERSASLDDSLRGIEQRVAALEAVEAARP